MIIQCDTNFEVNVRIYDFNTKLIISFMGKRKKKHFLNIYIHFKIFIG